MQPAASTPCTQLAHPTGVRRSAADAGQPTKCQKGMRSDDRTQPSLVRIIKAQHGTSIREQVRAPPSPHLACQCQMLGPALGGRGGEVGGQEGGFLQGQGCGGEAALLLGQALLQHARARAQLPRLLPGAPQGLPPAQQLSLMPPASDTCSPVRTDMPGGRGWQAMRCGGGVARHLVASPPQGWGRWKGKV